MVNAVTGNLVPVDDLYSAVSTRLVEVVGCANSFSLIAADLVPVCGGAEGYVPVVVNQLS
jgi:hypothetical protein